MHNLSENFNNHEKFTKWKIVPYILTYKSMNFKQNLISKMRIVSNMLKPFISVENRPQFYLLFHINNNRI